MKLYNIAENLILEVASRGDIMDGMQQRRIMELYYDDDGWNLKTTVVKKQAQLLETT